MRNSSMGPPWRIDLTTHHTMTKHSYYRATSPSSKEKKEMFYLMMHSTLYLWIMVKDHLDSERRNLLLPPLHGLLFPIRLSFTSHRQDSTYLDLCYISCGAWRIDLLTHCTTSTSWSTYQNGCMLWLDVTGFKHSYWL